MTNIFFHIGLHKTATTWFQLHLFPRLDDIEVLHTRHVSKIVLPERASPTLIVSHAGHGGTLSTKRRPGTSRKWLAENLRLITELVPNAAVIIGFREHSSWLNSTYSNKSKKNWGMDPISYVSTFSLDDLLWCETLRSIDRSCTAVFPFLFEELSRSPHVLVGDLCKFLGKAPPQNLDHLLSIRENSTPRSQVGRLASRSLFALSTSLPGKPFKRYCDRLGARLDRFFSSESVVLNRETARELNKDWNDLLLLIGERRGRDLLGLSRLLEAERNT